MTAPLSEPAHDAQRPERPPALHLLAVLLIASLVFLPYLGRGGFTSTEGHRVIPGWEMLETKNFFLPTMFGQVYLRKPPGMPWAVALSASLLGETEFSARLVSAASTIALALAATVFAARWFGRNHAIWAGIATALSPILWGPGRTAEIEALNNLGASLAVFLILDAFLHPRATGQPALRPKVRRGERASGANSQTARHALPRGLLLGLALTIAALAKGPAAIPAILGAIAAGALAARPSRARGQPAPRPAAGVPLLALTIALAISASILSAVFLKLAAAIKTSGQTPITQTVNDFLWTSRPFTLKSLAEVALMPLTALAMTLPWGLAMLFPWGKDAKAEAARADSSCHWSAGSAAGQWSPDARALRAARALTLACILSVLALALAGVRNPRYAQPCIAFVPILAAYTARGFAAAGAAAPAFLPLRRKLARAMCGEPALILCAAAACAFVLDLEPRTRPESGRGVGLAIADYLHPGDELLADHVIEARPEILLYTRQRTQNQVRIRWIPGLMDSPAPPSPTALLVLRRDPGSSEYAALEARGLKDRYHEVAAGRVHKFDVGVFRPRP
jgi:4-amino-4-deoxy-L-arabinose transferase-like glycosyltransferase